MPRRPLSICRQPGCRALIAAPGYCAAHSKAKQQQEDDRRGTAHERGYTSAWARARGHYLRAHPLCVYCKREGLITAANVVDHIVPHKLKDAIDSGDEAKISAARALFWDSTNNWCSLCAHCHNGAKQREERSANTTYSGPAR